MDVEGRGFLWEKDLEYAGHMSGSENTAVFWLESTDCRKGHVRD